MLINSIPIDEVGGAYSIAVYYLKLTRGTPANADVYEPIFDSIVEDFRAGSTNKLRLANRAIARIEAADVLELLP
jgi:hypothetical protein